MADTNNVFISWSGERSRLAAEALTEWLGTVLQSARPWMSTEIEKGSRSFEEIARALEGMKVGIICLTPENLTSEWLHYEAGALSKTLDAKTRVCTYLLADLESATLKAPLSWFQWTRANKTDTRKLIGTINKHLDAAPVQESKLDTLFEKMWPDLDAKLKALPVPSSAPPVRRSTDDMVAELLELTRKMAPAIADVKEETDITRRTRRLTAALRQQGIHVTGSGGGYTLLSSLAGVDPNLFVDTTSSPPASSSEDSADPTKSRHLPLPSRRAYKK